MGNLTVSKALKGQLIREDFQAQDRFNITLTKKKRDMISRKRKRKMRETYVPSHGFNEYTGG